MREAVSAGMREYLAKTGLVPEGIEKFQSRCTVCTGPLPTNRANVNTRFTCKPDCFAVQKAKTKLQLEQRRCPNCLHPASQAERADFMAWRRHRGEAGLGTGFQRRFEATQKRAETLAAALGEAVEMMHRMDGTVKQSGEPILEGDYQAAIARFEKLIDTKDGKRSKLAASGQTCDGEPNEFQGDDDGTAEQSTERTSHTGE
jgi:hypothetical protein